MPDTLTIEFGALAKPVSEQLKMQGFDVPNNIALGFDMVAHSIVVLRLHGIISDSVRDSSRKKLMKRISKAVHAGDS